MTNETPYDVNIFSVSSEEAEALPFVDSLRRTGFLVRHILLDPCLPASKRQHLPDEPSDLSSLLVCMGGRRSAEGALELAELVYGCSVTVSLSRLAIVFGPSPSSLCSIHEELPERKSLNLCLGDESYPTNVINFQRSWNETQSFREVILQIRGFPQTPRLFFSTDRVRRKTAELARRCIPFTKITSSQYSERASLTGSVEPVSTLSEILKLKSSKSSPVIDIVDNPGASEDNWPKTKMQVPSGEHISFMAQSDLERMSMEAETSNTQKLFRRVFTGLASAIKSQIGECFHVFVFAYGDKDLSDEIGSNWNLLSRTSPFKVLLLTSWGCEENAVVGCPDSSEKYRASRRVSDCKDQFLWFSIDDGVSGNTAHSHWKIPTAFPWMKHGDVAASSKTDCLLYQIPDPTASRDCNWFSPNTGNSNDRVNIRKGEAVVIDESFLFEGMGGPGKVAVARMLNLDRKSHSESLQVSKGSLTSCCEGYTPMVAVNPIAKEWPAERTTNAEHSLWPQCRYRVTLSGDFLGSESVATESRFHVRAWDYSTQSCDSQVHLFEMSNRAPDKVRNRREADMLADLLYGFCAKVINLLRRSEYAQLRVWCFDRCELSQIAHRFRISKSAARQRHFRLLLRLRKDVDELIESLPENQRELLREATNDAIGFRNFLALMVAYRSKNVAEIRDSICGALEW